MLKMLLEVGLVVAMIVIGLVVIRSSVPRDERGNVQVTKKLILSITATIIVIAIVGLSIEWVDKGHVGIKYHMLRGVSQDTLSQGLKITSPLTRVTDYPIYIQNLKLEGEEGFKVPSKDGKQIQAEIAIDYTFDPELLPTTWENFGGKSPRQIENYHIKSKIRAWASDITSQYYVIDLYSDKRTVASEEILEILQERFAKDGIMVKSFSFINLYADETSAKAIQERVDAQQALEKSRIEKERKEIEASTKLMEAEAEAKAKVIRAEAEKKSNELLEKSLTPALLEQQWIEKWDGILPQVSGDGVSPIVNMRQNKQ